MHDEVVPVQRDHDDGEGRGEREEQGQEGGQGAQQVRQRQLPVLGVEISHFAWEFS